MDELSAVWYSGFQWNHNNTPTYHQTKVAVAIIVLILCGFLLLVVGFVEENSQMRTGGFTMFGLGFLILVCLCSFSYFKKRSSREGAMQRNESSLTERLESVECYELILSDHRTSDRRRLFSEGNTSASRWDISFLLSRILGSPPTYEEVITDTDFSDVTASVSCAPPPYHADISGHNYEDVEVSPPSYESSEGVEASQV